MLPALEGFMTTRTNADVLIIGGGHNGLVCAAYLAAAGLKVRVLERRHLVGGAAVTEEFHPGFRNSVASYTVSLLNPKVIADLRLAQHGLRVVERPYANFLPLPDGRSFRLGGAHTESEIAKFAPGDVARWADYTAMLDRVVAVLKELIHLTPPNIGERIAFADWLGSYAVAKRLKHLDLRGRRDLLDLFTKSAGELLDHYFEGEPLKAVLGWDSVVGNFASPYTPGSAYVLLHHLFGEVNGKTGVWGHAIGGMGAITQAMRKECEARGVAIDTDAEVAKLIVENEKAIGVVLGRWPRTARAHHRQQPQSEAAVHEAGRAQATGRRHRAAHRTLSQWVRHVPHECRAGRAAGLHRDAGHAAAAAPFQRHPDRAVAAVLRAGLFRCEVEVAQRRLGAQADRRGRHLLDAGRHPAPAGQHVASLFCQQVNPDVDGGWDAHRDTVAKLMIDTVNDYAPNFARSVIGYEALSPLDLERRIGLVGGDIFHGALGLDQMFSARPLLGQGNYRGAFKQLYLCGSGTHPGGGVTGLPGRNAAREILKDLRKGPRPD
jgi:phytoene dehydrogenase-like protein